MYYDFSWEKASLNGSTIIARQEDYGQALNPQRFVLVTPDQQPRKYASKTTSFKYFRPRCGSRLWGLWGCWN